jgi:mRNA interferase MazF
MAYVPDRGDVVWLDFTPQAGHEQAGRRPAVVLSPVVYNKKVGLALLCPITNQVKGTANALQTVYKEGVRRTGGPQGSSGRKECEWLR